MSEYQELNRLLDLDNNVNSSDVEIIEISHFVPSWIMKVSVSKSSSLKVAQIVIDTLVSFTTVQFIISEEEIYNVSNLVNKFKPLCHHLLPGIVATCDATNVKEMCTLLKPYILLERCLLLIKHMRAPHSISVIPKKQTVEVVKEINYENVKKMERKCKYSTEPEVLFTTTLLLPRSAVTFLIGKGGHSIARIRQQTSATIKIHQERTDIHQSKDEQGQGQGQGQQKVEIAAPTQKELARAQALVLTRLSQLSQLSLR